MLEKQLQQQNTQIGSMQKQHQALQQQHAQCQANQQQQQQQQAQNQGAQINPQEFEQMKKEYQAAIVERDRFQSQLEMLVQELEKSQVDNYKRIFRPIFTIYFLNYYIIMLMSFRNSYQLVLFIFLNCSFF